MIKLIKRLFKVKRYFIISYVFFLDEYIYGYVDEITNGGYPKLDNISKPIKERFGCIEESSVIILNIIELTKKEYNEFYE